MRGVSSGFRMRQAFCVGGAGGSMGNSSLAPGHRQRGTGLARRSEAGTRGVSEYRWFRLCRLNMFRRSAQDGRTGTRNRMDMVERPNLFDSYNAAYAQALFEQYLQNPAAVDESWRQLFASGAAARGGLLG